MTGLDPNCFKGECVKSLVEIITPPCPSFRSLVRSYVRDDRRYRLKARIVGYERFLHAGRCAGVHLHIELPPGTVFPDVKVARKALPAVRQELLDVYNLATALDPALVALTRACPFYEGWAPGLATRTARYRGVFGVDGVYANVPEAGSLQPYAGRVEDLIECQNARYRAWFRAMDEAKVERRLFAGTEGNSYRASWNPIRLNPLGTLEIRSMDGNYPGVILPVCALVLEAIERLRHEHLRVRPTLGVRSFEVNGDELLVPDFAYLSGDLLRSAVTRGTEEPGVRAYLDSFMAFATRGRGSGYLRRLKTPEGAYRTTEDEILRAFPATGSSIAQEQGLRLVREACRELERQVSFLHREYRATDVAARDGERSRLPAFRPAKDPGGDL